ncbi:MAG: hypothetical protein IJO32_04125 [Bacilli bacterium]|nr:hypothetical protein [Bacilli bacterium]
MKNRILTFIIGVLIGAIIMALIFLFFNKPFEDRNINNFPPNENEQIRRPNGNMEMPPEKPNGNMQMQPR